MSYAYPRAETYRKRRRYRQRQSCHQVRRGSGGGRRSFGNSSRRRAPGHQGGKHPPGHCVRGRGPCRRQQAAGHDRASHKQHLHRYACQRVVVLRARFVRYQRRVAPRHCAQAGQGHQRFAGRCEKRLCPRGIATSDTGQDVPPHLSCTAGRQSET